MATAGELVTVSCPGCGKALRVPAERVGRGAKCPACGTTFTVPGGAVAGAVGAAGGTYAAGAKKRPDQGPTGSFVVSPTLITFGGIFLAVAVGVMIFVFGPLRTKEKWEAMEPKARDACENVLIRSLQCYLSEKEMWDPSKGRGAPQEQNFMFDNVFSMTMPERVGFSGNTSSGGFKGWYHPATGEVEADVEIGGTVLPSGVMVRHGNQNVHVTGRQNGSDVQVEIDGKPGQIVNWNTEKESAH